MKLDWQGNLRFSPDEIIVLGAEHQRDEIRQPIAAGTTINSGYAELQSTLGDRLFNSASVRYDSNDRFGSDVTYREAPAFVIADTGTRLKGSVGSGFKAPTLSQMFENYPSFGFYGNPNLKPETSTGYDLGFEQSFADGAIPVRRHLVPQCHPQPDQRQCNVHVLRQCGTRGNRRCRSLRRLRADANAHTARRLHLHRSE